ncbi:phosphoribosylaminoimidazolesuccinocarboxamide synthase [Rickettsia endosymbiont of Halotydeus destructor]|uniref:phosphoribosylaminoimidazolesuccinocarboxamide synthase n=1 Tax=Rickettsia endosymbiont of Halotydeus destructor TaxID=2996754 RepID=UPI003BAF42F1
MKKSVLIISFVISIILVFGYLSHKFEDTTKNNILTVLDEYKEYITYDSITINKYTFSVTLQKVKFNYIDSYSDEIVIWHIPFLNITKIDSYGNGVKITTAENEESIFYAPDDHSTVWFRKSLFNNSPDFWKLSLNDNKSTIYSSKTAEKLAESEGNKITIIHSKTADNLHLLELDTQGNITFTSENYIKEISSKVNKFFKNAKEMKAAFEDLNSENLVKVTQLNSPMYNSNKLSLKYSDELLTLGKLFVQRFSASEKQDEIMHEAIFMQIVTELYKGKPFLFAWDSKINGKMQNNIYKINLEKDKKINFSFNIETTNTPSEIYEKAMVDSFSAHTFAGFKRGFNRAINELGPNAASKFNESLTQNDFAKMIEPFAKVKDSKFSIEVEFDPEEKKLSNKINLAMDKFNFAIDTNIPNLHNFLNFESVVTLSDPNVFIGNLTNYTNNAVIPIMQKIETSKIFAATLAKQMPIVREYGFDAVASLSKSSELKEGETLTVDIKRDDNHFTLNGKDYLQILSDERVIKFIDAMNALKEEGQ